MIFEEKYLSLFMTVFNRQFAFTSWDRGNFPTWAKSQDKNLNVIRTKSSRDKTKNIYFFEAESPTLIHNTENDLDFL